MLKYPNFENLEKIVRIPYFTENSPFAERLKGRKPNFEVYMFPQTWGSTALGFDEENVFSGQAMTDAYTVVFHEIESETYFVFFDDKLAYAVYDPSEIFYADFANRKLQTVRIAKKLY